MSSLIGKIDIAIGQLLSDKYYSSVRDLKELRNHILTGESTPYYTLNLALFVLFDRKYLNIDDLLEILNIACRTEWIEEFHSSSLENIIRYPNLLKYSESIISDKMFKKMLSDHLFSRIFSYYESNYNLINTYERFELVALELNRISPLISQSTVWEYYDALITYNQEYFLKSLKENPNKWVIDYCIISKIFRHDLNQFVYSNLPYTQDIVEHASRSDLSQRRNIDLKLVNKILHIKKCKIDVARVFTFGFVFQYIGAFYNDITEIEFYTELHGVRDNVPRYVVNTIIELLLAKFELVKPAHNYATQDGSWKLNFMRMINFNKNLDTLKSKIKIVKI